MHWHADHAGYWHKCDDPIQTDPPQQSGARKPQPMMPERATALLKVQIDIARTNPECRRITLVEGSLRQGQDTVDRRIRKLGEGRGFLEKVIDFKEHQKFCTEGRFGAERRCHNHCGPALARIPPFVPSCLLTLHEGGRALQNGPSASQTI